MVRGEGSFAIELISRLYFGKSISYKKKSSSIFVLSLCQLCNIVYIDQSRGACRGEGGMTSPPSLI